MPKVGAPAEINQRATPVHCCLRTCYFLLNHMKLEGVVLEELAKLIPGSFQPPKRLSTGGKFLANSLQNRQLRALDCPLLAQEEIMVKATFGTWASAKNSTQELFRSCPQDMGAGVPEHRFPLWGIEC